MGAYGYEMKKGGATIRNNPEISSHSDGTLPFRSLPLVHHIHSLLPSSRHRAMSFLPRLRQAAVAARRTYATVSDVSGVKVVGIDSGVLPAATTSITVVVKAGARYETQPGIAHVLKSFAFKVGQDGRSVPRLGWPKCKAKYLQRQSTASGSALKTARETELYGGVLSAALSREHLFLTAEFLRGDECVITGCISRICAELTEKKKPLPQPPRLGPLLHALLPARIL